jgi:hypothetical protein
MNSKNLTRVQPFNESVFHEESKYGLAGAEHNLYNNKVTIENDDYGLQSIRKKGGDDSVLKRTDSSMKSKYNRINNFYSEY